MPTRRQQPKRKIVSVERTGSYPDVWWEHRLVCGHVERRKRKSPAGRIACDLCGRASGVVVFDEDAELMTYEDQVRSELASRFRVEREAVDVSVYMDGGHPKVATFTVALFKRFA